MKRLISRNERNHRNFADKSCLCRKEISLASAVFAVNRENFAENRAWFCQKQSLFSIKSVVFSEISLVLRISAQQFRKSCFFCRKFRRNRFLETKNQVSLMLGEGGGSRRTMDLCVQGTKSCFSAFTLKMTNKGAHERHDKLTNRNGSSQLRFGSSVKPMFITS